MRPVRSEQWAASLVFDVPSTSELCDDDFAPHPARRTALLQNPSACADVRALHLQRYGRMHISTASLMQHLARFPFVQNVELTNLLLRTEVPTSPLHPVCASISELVIGFRDTHTSSDALFEMLPCLPRLRVLEMHGVWPNERRDDSLILPPLRLEQFSCTGIITVPACARIIACSARTLRAVRVTGIEKYSDSSGLGQLAQALLQVAPTLRELELSMPDNAAFEASQDALCGNLAGARIVSLQATSHDVLWNLARLLFPALRGHLQLTRTRPDDSPLTARAYVDKDFLEALGSAGIRSLVVSGFWIHWDATDDVFDVCDARRIPCTLID